MTTRWLTAHEAADYARVSVVTLRRAVAKGDLTAFHINHGRRVRFRAEDIDNWITAPAQPAGRQS